jgi:hypothetical protein
LEHNSSSASARLYLPDANILLTRFLADEGVAELTDYMPINADGKQPNEIIRALSVVRGEVNFKLLCQPRFNYALCRHEFRIEDQCAIFSPHEDVCPPMAHYSTIRLEREAQDVKAQFKLRAGEKATFLFGGVRPREQQPEMERVDERFPQAFTHLALISAATYLDRVLSGTPDAVWR